MAMSEVRKKFQEEMRRGVDQEALQIAQIQRVRQSLIRHKYRSVPQTENKGDKSENGREK